MSFTFTKSTFLSGIQCHKRLWYETTGQLTTPPPSPDQQRIIDQGQEVGQYARQQYPDGQLIDERGMAAVEATQRAIANGATCLFEAAFCYDDILIRCDILQRHPDNTWTLIEVKSSTKVKDEHFWDAAIQCYVLAGAGISLRTVCLMHINSKTCTHPNLSDLFICQDITTLIESWLAQIPKRLEQFRQIVAVNIPPERSIGQHCGIPNACPYESNCWQHVPEASIFTIPRLSWDKKQALIEAGVLAIADLPPDYSLTANQRAYVETVHTAELQIDPAAIAQRLAELTYPLHFFDFETFNPAIPRFNGLKPFEQYPFQYSCHILHNDGNLHHADYLHTDGEDPRLPLVEALVSHIAPTGSVVVYHKSFEGSLLKKLAATFPTYAEALLSICDRLWDLEDIFKHHYKHPDFMGKTSIKKVLPVVVPGFSYDNLEVQNGAIAQAVWDKMIRTPHGSHRQQLIAQLRDYCTQDTLAMVKIFQVLQGLH